MEILTNEQLDELRELMKDLDLVPLSVLPKECWCHVYEYYEKVAKDEIPFNTPIERDYVKELSERQKRRRIKQTQNELLPFNF